MFPILAIESLTPGQHIIIAVWVFMLGACIGSFLNVVVWRTPRGMSLIAPGSHCPRCGHSIRAYDNIPILAWLWLRGKCRDCHESISMRYPSIELLTGLMFLLLYLVALPQAPELKTGDEAVVRTGTELALLYSIYATLCATLLAGTLIERDAGLSISQTAQGTKKTARQTAKPSSKKKGEKKPSPVPRHTEKEQLAVPARIFAVPIALATALLLFVPGVAPMQAIAGPLSNSPQVGALLGGLILGSILGVAAGRFGEHASRFGRLMAIIAVGVCLGWQATIVITAAACVCYQLLRRPLGRQIPFLAWVTLFTIVLLCTWNQLLTLAQQLYT